MLVRSALVALYPKSGELPGVADTGVDAFLERFSAEAPAIVWIGVVGSALLFHLTPLFTVFVPLPAFLLPERLRDVHAERIASSSIYLVRQSIFLLKLPAALCWGADAAVRARFALPAYRPDPGTWRE